jgi:hypothetical protein
VGAVEWKAFVDELRQQWQLLWRERVDDKVRAEGMARDDFKLLFVDRGTVIIATRRFKQLDFREILDEYGAPYEVKVKSEVPLPRVGGWRKFGRTMAAARRGSRTRRSWSVDAKDRRQRQQLKQGGRGWLHASV